MRRGRQRLDTERQPAYQPRERRARQKIYAARRVAEHVPEPFLPLHSAANVKLDRRIRQGSQSILDPGYVLTGSGIDAQPFVHFYEKRDLHNGARLEGGGLGCAGGRVATYTRLGIGYLEHHKIRGCQADRLIVPKRRETNILFFEPLRGIP